MLPSFNIDSIKLYYLEKIPDLEQISIVNTQNLSRKNRHLCDQQIVILVFLIDIDYHNGMSLPLEYSGSYSLTFAFL
jgi:hypothetical protein